LKNLARLLTSFLGLFADCFASLAGRQLLKLYVKGQLSDVQRKNCEAMALKFHQAPRTLQRFLESINWNEEKVRDRCQQIIARDHAHDEAIGTVDESGTTKSGSCTAGLRGNTTAGTDAKRWSRKTRLLARGPGQRCGAS
jgi:SRSO17 transposase